MGEVRNVSTLTELHEIVNENDRVVLNLSKSVGCVYCNRLAPHYEKAAEKSDAVFVKVDLLDAESSILDTYPTQSVPTVFLIQKGEETKELSGRTSIALLKEIG